MDLILRRRSIRKYTSEPVAEEDVRCLLEAAMAAPSARNLQPWHLVVITERRLLDAVPSFHDYASMITQAPLAILVCADETSQEHPGYWAQDCAAATQNILLAAVSLGLGAVWLGIHPRPKRIDGVRKLLGLPGHIHPVALVVVGHPAESKPPSDRYDPAKVHRNGW